MAVDDCQLAVDSCQVENGGSPSAHDQGTHRIRGSPDPFWVSLGHFRAFWAGSGQPRPNSGRSEQ